MKKVLSITLSMPLLICFVLFDIVKLPFILFLFAPISLYMALIDFIKGDLNWFNNWIQFNFEIGCFTYLMKDDLFRR